MVSKVEIEVLAQCVPKCKVSKQTFLNLSGCERSGKSSEIRSRWVPDPTFLEMSPVTSIFPAHDKQTWERGDLSTDALGAYIGGWSVVLVHF